MKMTRKNRKRVVVVEKAISINNTNKPRGKKGRRNRRKRPTMQNNSAFLKVAMQACSITDAFCPAAREAKFPDSTSQRTLTYQFRQTFSTSNSAAGASAVLVYANPFYPCGTATLSTGTWTAATPSTGACATFLATYANKVRIVSFGVNVFNAASATNASGFLNSNVVPDLGTGKTWAQGSRNWEETVASATTTGFEQVCLARPRAPDRAVFQPSATYNSSSIGSFPGWDNFIFELSAGPASVTSLYYEVVMNLEYVPFPDDALAVTASRSPVENGYATTVANSVQGRIQPIINAGREKAGMMIENLAIQAAKNLAGYAVGALATRFGGPNMGAIAYGATNRMIMDVD